MSENEKKKKIKELSKDEKSRLVRTAAITLSAVAIVCCILVGCFACKQDVGNVNADTVMTDEQKASYWKAQIIGVSWEPMTDATNDGVLKGLFLPRDARTDMDGNTGLTVIHFMFNETDVMDSAEIVLTNESGELRFASDDVWTVKFSEKNDVLFMTITDSDGKVVYYQQK